MVKVEAPNITQGLLDETVIEFPSLSIVEGRVNIWVSLRYIKLGVTGRDVEKYGAVFLTVTDTVYI